jgi:urease accessory protein
MLTASKLVPSGKGLAPVLLKRASSVELDWDVRQKSRFEATDTAGRQVGVFLPRGTVVRGGDVLVTEDGSLVRVNAAPQPVMVIRHCPHHGTPFDLVRAAYHLGNRHVPIELQPDHLKIEPDPVLADMLDRMHLIVTREDRAFEPESGAYQATHAGHAGHGHDHGHTHGHGHGNDHSGHEDHGHGHDHAHGPAQTQAHEHAHPHEAHQAHNHAHGAGGHVHGPGCKHDH